jgi:putative ABC transport system permease protein
MTTLLDDAGRLLRHAFRSLRRRPVLATVGLTTLGLGIGANTAMFSILNVVFLKPLPIREPDRVVMVWTTRADEGLDEQSSSYPDFKDWREQSKSFAALAAFWMFPNGDVNLTGGAEPQRVSVARITPGFFETMGIAPLHGRTFQDEETILGNHRRAILSYGLWRNQFGGDTSLVGRDVQVNGVPYTVVGVMPSDLETRAVAVLGTDVQLWRPLVPEDNQTGGRGSRRLRVLGRLAPGVTTAQAQSELASVAMRLGETYPETNRATGVRLVPLRDQIVKDVRRGLLFLLAAVGVVLLGACANVANLLLIKAASNRKQSAVQHALGASRVRLALQVVAEALVLGAGGVVVGLLLAFGIVQAFVTWGPADIPLLADARIDVTVLALTVSAMLLAVLLASLLPAWRSSTPDDAALLRQNMSRARGQGDRRAMKALAVTQIALAMVLLSVGGILIRSFSSLLSIDPGVDPRGVLTFQVELPMAATARYPSQPLRDDFFERLRQRLSGLPGVQTVSIASAPPLEEDPSASSLRLPGEAEARALQVNFRVASPEYFDLLRIPLRAGRVFSATDSRTTPRVVVVSDALARTVWQGDNAVGKRIFVFGNEEAEVVGVVGNVRTGGLDADAGRTVYMSTTQTTFNFMTVLVRTSADPLSLVPEIRMAVRQLDTAIPLHRIRTLDDLVSSSVAHQRFQMLLVSAFSALMLLLAVVGTYGVTAYGVSERTNELGIRAALGASANDIRRLVLGEGVRLALLGVVVGAVVVLALSGLLARFVFGVGSLDPLTLALVPLVLVLAMLFAAFVPAYRASRTDPMRALRSD